MLLMCFFLDVQGSECSVSPDQWGNLMRGFGTNDRSELKHSTLLHNRLM